MGPMLPGDSVQSLALDRTVLQPCWETQLVLSGCPGSKKAQEGLRSRLSNHNLHIILCSDLCRCVCRGVAGTQGPSRDQQCFSPPVILLATAADGTWHGVTEGGKLPQRAHI